MPKSHRSYFYPSVSAGFVFSELIPQNDVLSFGKFRVELRQCRQRHGALRSSTSSTTPESSEVFRTVRIGTNSISRSAGCWATMAPADLSRSRTSNRRTSLSFEIGTDLRFFNGRIRVWMRPITINKTTKNIVRLDVANSTRLLLHAQERRHRSPTRASRFMAGFDTGARPEISAGIMDVNFASNRQLVKKLDPSITSYTLSAGFNSLQIKAAEGEPFSLYGTYWMTDDEGNYIIKDDGTRAVSETTKNLGKVAPDWTMGISNTLRYRNLSLSFLIDVRYGGVMYSGTVSDLRANGMAEETIGKNRTDIVDKGVKQDGTENTTAITPYQFWSNNYSSKVSEANVFDATFVKLREMVLSYQMPQRWFKNCFIGSLALGVEGRNLWLMKSNVPHIDPETNIFGPSAVGSGVEYSAIPTTRSWGFNIKLTF